MAYAETFLKTLVIQFNVMQHKMRSYRFPSNHKKMSDNFTNSKVLAE